MVLLLRDAKTPIDMAFIGGGRRRAGNGALLPVADPWTDSTSVALHHHGHQTPTPTPTPTPPPKFQPSRRHAQAHSYYYAVHTGTTLINPAPAPNSVSSDTYEAGFHQWLALQRLTAAKLKRRVAQSHAASRVNQGPYSIERGETLTDRRQQAMSPRQAG